MQESLILITQIACIWLSSTVSSTKVFHKLTHLLITSYQFFFFGILVSHFIANSFVASIHCLWPGHTLKMFVAGEMYSHFRKRAALITAAASELECVCLCELTR